MALIIEVSALFHNRSTGGWSYGYYEFRTILRLPNSLGVTAVGKAIFILMALWIDIFPLGSQSVP